MKRILIAIILLAIAAYTAPVLAQQGGGGGAGGSGGSAGASAPGSSSGIQDRDQTRDRIQDPTTHTGDEPLQIRDQDRLYQATSAPAAGSGNQNQYQGGTPQPNQQLQGQGAQTQTQAQYRLQIDPQHLQVRAGNAAQLQQMTQTRAQELNQYAASSSPSLRPIVQNGNRTQLAAHVFLAAQDLVGSSSAPQLVQLANQIQSTVQQTTDAQQQLQDRGFLTRFLFGGDAQTGSSLSGTAVQNLNRIQQMTQVLSQASTTPEVRAQLESQLQSMQQEQLRLQQLGESEQNQWGLFSWRF